jgi:hypothetical protein
MLIVMTVNAVWAAIHLRPAFEDLAKTFFPTHLFVAAVYLQTNKFWGSTEPALTLFKSAPR